MLILQLDFTDRFHQKRISPKGCLPERLNGSFVLKMTTSIGFNRPCKYCIIFTVDHSKAFLETPNNLSLNYERFDTFPDFPQLDSSAKAGCDFCGLLRISCQSHCSREQPFAGSASGRSIFEGNVQIYNALITSVGVERGMTTLQFSIRPTNSAQDSSSLATIYFNLYAYSGKN